MNRQILFCFVQNERVYFVSFCCVAPCAGAWVEISLVVTIRQVITVAPCAGAWVEIRHLDQRLGAHPCRSLCGSVG